MKEGSEISHVTCCIIQMQIGSCNINCLNQFCKSCKFGGPGKRAAPIYIYTKFLFFFKTTILFGEKPTRTLPLPWVSTPGPFVVQAHSAAQPLSRPNHGSRGKSTIPSRKYVYKCWMNSIANVSLLECSFEQTLLGEIAN